uniref:Uncharacterized protein n=1 Tax=Trieres chinensis TaxID=1514140 RepID=A0A7S2EIM7_TRICV
MIQARHQTFENIRTTDDTRMTQTDQANCIDASHVPNLVADHEPRSKLSIQTNPILHSALPRRRTFPIRADSWSDPETDYEENFPEKSVVAFCDPIVTEVYLRPSTESDEMSYLYYSRREISRFKRRFRRRALREGARNSDKEEETEQNTFSMAPALPSCCDHATGSMVASAAASDSKGLSSSVAISRPCSSGSLDNQTSLIVRNRTSKSRSRSARMA